MNVRRSSSQTKVRALNLSQHGFALKSIGSRLTRSGMTMGQRLLAIGLIGAFSSLAGADGHAKAAWQISDASTIGITSTKNDIVSERHTLKAISGGIDQEGVFSLTLDLSQIETNIPIRNERMQTWLFGDAPDAKITSEIAQDVLDSAQSGTVEQVLVVTANQRSLTLSVPIKVAYGENETRVTGELTLDVAELGYAAGIEKLREIAGLKVISTRVPVDFDLVLIRD